MEQLTSEQQEIINNSLWVVNAALKKLGLQTSEDYRQSGILYLCKCLLRFDASKKTKWTTYAYKNVYFYLKRIHNDENKYQNCLLNEDYESIEELIGDEVDADECLYNRLLVEKIEKICSNEENQIMRLRATGKRFAEIANIMGYNTTDILNVKIKKIRKKTQLIKEEFLGVKNGETNISQGEHLAKQENQ